MNHLQGKAKSNPGLAILLLPVLGFVFFAGFALYVKGDSKKAEACKD